ncbi:MAG: hypothetical protein DRO62_02805 [Candidatus Altiarchaeales archaeon]|nr:MAG: hypothetical protein DRO62_02805 [Candidatus Altiarchaeales archaeon]
MKIIVAVTGTSGVILAERLLENLNDHDTYLIVSHMAEKIAGYEGVDLGRAKKSTGHFYRENELDADIASSSHSIDTMVVIPCSMKTLSAIANGFCNNLITRAAENILKMGKKLILVPRDTPLSLSSIENMRRAKISGAVILPPNMAYYYRPKTLDDVTNFFVGKVLDALGIEHDLYKKWSRE